MVSWKTFSPNLHTVLIVSDDLEMASMWKSFFHQRNCHVINESSPQTALKSARYFPPSLIVLNLDLPQVQRLELCRELRATTEGTLLVLSQSSIDDRHLLEYIKTGVDELIPTPINPMALLIKSMAWLVRQEYVMAV